MMLGLSGIGRACDPAGPGVLMHIGSSFEPVLAAKATGVADEQAVAAVVDVDEPASDIVLHQAAATDLPGGRVEGFEGRLKSIIQ